MFASFYSGKMGFSPGDLKFRKLSKSTIKKIFPCSGKKFLQGFQGCRIDPAIDFLPPPLNTDESGPTQLLDMMGKG